MPEGQDNLIDIHKKGVSGIYRIDFPCGHFYIGSAKCLYTRRCVHISRLRKQNHDNSNLQRHFNKYGEEKMMFTLIDIVADFDRLVDTEQKMINEYQPYINILKKAGTSLGYKHGMETISKLKKLARGKANSPEWLSKVSKSWFKKGMTDNPFKGRKHTEATRALIAQKIKALPPRDLTAWINAGRQSSKRAVNQYDLDGNFIANYSSIKEALQAIGGKKIDHLSRVCKGKKKAYLGFKWQFSNGIKSEPNAI